MAAIFKLYMERHPDAKLIVAAHADERASQGENLKLSQRRADRVKAYLVEQGISEGNIETSAFGKDQRLEMDAVEQLDAQNPNGQSQDKNKSHMQHSYNHRVDVSIGGVESMRWYPYNAADIKVLVSEGFANEATIKKNQ